MATKAKLKAPAPPKKPVVAPGLSERPTTRLRSIASDCGHPQIEDRISDEITSLKQIGPLAPVSALMEANERRKAMEGAWRASQRLWQHCFSALQEPGGCTCAARVPCPKYQTLRADFDRALLAADDICADEDISPC